MAEPGKDDPLEGFRGKNAAQVEAEFRERLGQNAYLIDVYQMGDAMRGFIDNPAGFFIIKSLNDRMNRALLALLEGGDTGPEMMAKLFEARAAFTALELIETTIKDGIDAERKIASEDPSTETQGDT